VAKKGRLSGQLFQCTKRAMAARQRKAVHRVFERHQEIMERRKSDEGSEGGFTLIELLIVIVVLGILAAIVVFSLTGVSGESKQAACTADAKSVEVAADAYEAANSGAIPSLDDLTNGSGVGGVTYLHSLPSTANGYTISLDGSGSVNVQIGSATTVFSDSSGCNSIS
jgi:prepilin-type N-terminal cleavage/methylation domain-containing protein